MPAPRTDRQESFIRRLVDERPQVLAGFGVNVDEFLVQHAATRTAASATISNLLAMPREARPQADAAPIVDPPVGLHERDERLIRVVLSRGTGRLYAKDVTDGGDEYLGRAGLRGLTDETLVTYERAVELGQRGDWCLYGHPLDDPLSVVRGIGPTCERRHFPHAPKRSAQAKRDAEVAIQTAEGKARARAEFLAALRGDKIVEVV